MCRPIQDATTIFYNPFRRKWVFSVKQGFTSLAGTLQYVDSECGPSPYATPSYSRNIDRVCKAVKKPLHA